MAAVSLADTYQGIGPLDTLGDVKAKFPGATYEKIDAAWLTEKDAFYKVSGTGILGTIRIAFDDDRPYFQNRQKESIVDYSEYINADDDTALTVSWVRFSPEYPIPLQRLISKYGNPSKSSFDDDSFIPRRMWESRGIIANLSDNEKDVFNIEYTFTKKDYIEAYKARNKPIPDWLKSEKKPQSKNPKKSK